MTLRSQSLLAMLLVTSAAWAAPTAPQVEVFKNPYCGCCGQWVEHLRKSGFQVQVHETNDVTATRKQLGMPDKFVSCHTAKIGNYVFEGHVPATDIKRLLKEKPKALGLAVPSMPPGSPGMESAKPIPYETLLVQADGTHTVFAHH